MSYSTHPQPQATTAGVAPARSGRLAGFMLGAGAFCVAMIAGMFFDWATSIMPALAASDDRTYVVFMQQSINTINTSPLFLLSMLGAFVFTAVAAVLLFRLGARSAALWTVAGFVLYFIAVVITASVHFPLNDMIQYAGDPDTIDLAGLRAATEGPWTSGHLLRTLATTLSIIFLLRALLLAHRGGPARR